MFADRPFQKNWESIEKTVNSILKSREIPEKRWTKCLIRISTLCCTESFSYENKLYEETGKLLERHVRDLRNLIESENIDLNNEFLGRYNEIWSKYYENVKKLNELYAKCNETRKKENEILELGRDIWHTFFIQIARNKLKQSLLEGIEANRCGSNDEDRDKIINEVAHSFVEMQKHKKANCFKLLKDLLEIPLLKESRKRYEHVSSDLLQCSTVSAYLEEVVKILEVEEKCAMTLLPKSSCVEIRREFLDIFLYDRDKSNFVQSKFKEMVTEEMTKDLRNIYILIKTPQGEVRHEHDQRKKIMLILTQNFKEHIKNKVSATMSKLKGTNIHMIFFENILSLHKKYMEFTIDVFENDIHFLSAFNEVYSSMMNSEQSAKYMASYIYNTLLCRSKEEMNQKLSENGEILKYFKDNDVFIEYVRLLIFKRIVFLRLQSLDKEEEMLKNLKTMFHINVDILLNDFKSIQKSVYQCADFEKKFKDHLRKKDIELCLSLTVKVLPVSLYHSKAIEFIVPENFKEPINAIEVFFKNNCKGRKLTWAHEFSTGQLQLCYLKKTYIVTMSMYQMSILMLFESFKSRSFGEIQQALKLNNNILRTSLKDLFKYKLLRASSKELEKNTEINLNLEYSNERTKFKLPWELVKEEISQKENDEQDRSRTFRLQAAIMRIMKSRKTLSHKDLIEEILSKPIGTFNISVDKIKSVIETLIEREFIERDSQSKDLYNYLP